MTLASWAGIAIENARLYTSLCEREAEVEQALRRAETSVDIARTVGGETDVERVLDLIVKRARALVEAKALLVLLRRGDRLFVAAHAGEVSAEVGEPRGADRGRCLRRGDGGTGLPPARPRLAALGGALRERLGAEAALVVPLLFRGRAVGLLVALDREAGGVDSTMRTCGCCSLCLERGDGGSDRADGRGRTTATAGRVGRAGAGALGARAPRRRPCRTWRRSGSSWRRRWRRAERTGPSGSRGRRRQTIGAARGTDHELNRLINDLRPAALERLGLTGALQALAEESSARSGVAIDPPIELADERSGEEDGSSTA